LRHPTMADTIRRFFADASTNSVRAFYAEDTGLGGYVFYVLNPKNSANEDDCGRFYKLVTTVEVMTEQGSRVIRSRLVDRERIERQFSHNEWFTGPFRGRLDRVAAVHIEETSSEDSDTDNLA
jgi:hypothetical protein